MNIHGAKYYKYNCCITRERKTICNIELKADIKVYLRFGLYIYPALKSCCTSVCSIQFCTFGVSYAINCLFKTWINHFAIIIIAARDYFEQLR